MFFMISRLRRLDADRLKHPERGRPYGRSFGATKQRLRERALSRGVKRPPFRRWRGVEQDLAVRYAGSYVAGGRPDQMDLAHALRRELRGLGYLRTAAACRAGELPGAGARVTRRIPSRCSFSQTG